MSDTSTLVLALRTVAALAVVLAVLVYFMRWLEKNTSRPRHRGGAHVALDVLARAQLSKSGSVHVVRVGGQVLVLGVTEHCVEVLTDLGPADFEHDHDPGLAGALSASDGDAGGRRRAAISAQGQAASNVVEMLLRRQGKHRDARERAPESSDTSQALRSTSGGKLGAHGD